MIRFISRDTKTETWDAECFEFYDNPCLRAGFERLVRVTVYIDPSDGECEIRFSIDGDPDKVGFFTSNPYSENPRASEIEWERADPNQVLAELDNQSITLGDLEPVFKTLGQEAWIRC